MQATSRRGVVPPRVGLRAALAALPWNQFGDSRTAILGNPYFLTRSALRAAFATASSGLPSGPLLDVGCGTVPYRDIFGMDRPYECLEIDRQNTRTLDHVDHYYDGTDFGLPEDAYSVVFSSEVLEHSFDPETLLGEAHRVLRPGGVLLLSIPFFWPEHEQPNDSQRFTSFGLCKRLTDAGFLVTRVRKTNPGMVTLIQLSIELVERHVRRMLRSVRPGLARLVVGQTVRALLAPAWTAANLVGAALRELPLHSEPEMFQNLVVLAVKPAMESDGSDG